MYHGTQSGWIEVITGVMFSGKSEELIRRVRRAVIARKRVQVFTSHLDDRYHVFSVTTHDGLTVEAHPVSTAREIAAQARPDTSVVAIDEVQFLDGGIVDNALHASVKGTIGEVEVDARVEIGSASMSIADVSSVAPGDVLSFDEAASDGMTLCVANSPVFRVNPGRDGVRRAFKVTGVVELEEDVA